MQIFANTNFDFLTKKWLFIGISLVLMALTLVSLLLKGGPTYGIDFRGGALMYVRFAEQPPVQQIRSALSARIGGEITVQQVTGENELVIGTELRDESALNVARQQMVQTLSENFGGEAGKPDFNNAGVQVVLNALREPLQRRGVFLNEQQLEEFVERIVNVRNTQHSGLLRSFDQLSGVEGVTPVVIEVLKQELTLARFTVRQVEMVGPKVGADLRRQAILATLYALGGMLVYIAFRFEWIYGVGAVAAVFHDAFITVGVFSLLNQEISLTVVAALLTLVGYSMNDTIVIFDRIRENLKSGLRRERLEKVMNDSINQTLSRTALTTGLTFLTVLALLLFGGPVLYGFALALTVGIVVGTYSSVFIASPIVLFWHNYVDSRKRTAAAPAGAAAKEAIRKRGQARVR
jgi:preprotein translocase subunit SecF